MRITYVVINFKEDCRNMHGIDIISAYRSDAEGHFNHMPDTTAAAEGLKIIEIAVASQPTFNI